jgi:hypothetical protein
MLSLGLGINRKNGGINSVPPPPSYAYVLDDYPTNALYAFSFRKLRSAYAGPCCRIRRSSDNAETDIGFNGNYIDEAAMSAFIGADNAFYTKWYDQTGNGLDKVQTVALNQPIAATAGVLFKSGGLIAMDAQSGGRGLQNLVTGAGTSAMTFFVFTRLSTAAEVLPATNITGGGRFYGVMQNNPVAPESGAGTPSYYKNLTIFAAPTRKTLFDNFGANRAAFVVTNINFTSWIESSNLYPSYLGIVGFNFEEINYSTQTESRTDITQNLIDYYGL